MVDPEIIEILRSQADTNQRLARRIAGLEYTLLALIGAIGDPERVTREFEAVKAEISLDPEDLEREIKETMDFFASYAVERGRGQS